MEARTYEPAARLDTTRGGETKQSLMIKYNQIITKLYADINDLLDTMESDTSITIDGKMNKYSMNPVQNKVVTTYLAANYYTKDELWQVLWG